MDTSNDHIEIDRKGILARLANDEDLLREMIEIFREDYPGLLQRIESAIAAWNRRDVEQAAHALKGLISNFLHPPTTALALNIERKARANEWSDMDSDFQELTYATTRLLEALDSSNSEP